MHNPSYRRMVIDEEVGYKEEEESENEIETLSRIPSTVGKAKIEIDKNALGILHQIKEEIIADDISDYTYSGTIRRLYEYRLGVREGGML